MMAMSGNVVGEQLRAERLLEAMCFDWCFELIELLACFVIVFVVFPFEFGCDWLVDIWKATEFEAQFRGGQALAGDAV